MNFRIVLVFVFAILLVLPTQAQSRRETLEKHSWKLKRLGDSVMPRTGPMAMMLQFGDSTYNFSGFCNKATGKYWTRGISRIGFDAPVGTWHTCPGSNLDARLVDMLRRANRFRVHSGSGERSLSLRRGWRVLAVLEAM